jgi:hypothetical protein
MEWNVDLKWTAHRRKILHGPREYGHAYIRAKLVKQEDDRGVFWDLQLYPYRDYDRSQNRNLLDYPRGMRLVESVRD